MLHIETFLNGHYRSNGCFVSFIPGSDHLKFVSHTLMTSIFSVLPPSTTLRRYLRRAYATTAGQIGQLYCDVLSMTTVHDPMKTEKIVKNLIAVRMKLNRTRALRRNVAYEVSGEGFFLWFDI